MSNFLKVIVFSLLVIGLYTFYSAKMVPPITPEPPPKNTEAKGPISTDELISLGEGIYNGKGSCTLCHNPVGGRAPLLERAAAVAAERIKDPSYKGKALTPEEYLHESLVDPSAHVVKGFGVAGTNDKESPMPDVRSGAIGMNELEINAVVAYLQKLAGVEVTVKLPGSGAGMVNETTAGAVK